MTAKEAIEEYISKFGWYPYFLLMGASDEIIVATLTKCIEENKELETKDDADVVY